MDKNSSSIPPVPSLKATRAPSPQEEFDRRLGHDICRLRTALGWSQWNIASLLGVSRSTVSQIEAGARKVTAHELSTLCTALLVDPRYLLGLVQETAIGWPPRPVPVP